MKLFSLVSASALVLAAFTSAASAAPVVMDFTGGSIVLADTSGNGVWDTYTQNGYTVAVKDAAGDHTDAANALYMHNGCCNANDNVEVRMTFTGGAFDFLSADVTSLSGSFDYVTSTGMSGSVASAGLWSTNLANITWIDFVIDSTRGNRVAVLDNLTTQAASAVPEPGSLALIGLALAGLGVSRKAKRK